MCNLKKYYVKSYSSEFSDIELSIFYIHNRCRLNKQKLKN